MNKPLDSSYTLPGFDNRFIEHLPADPCRDNTRRQVSGACYSHVEPVSVRKPLLVSYSSEVAEILGFSQEFCESEEFVQVYSGNRLLPGMVPYAMCYGGHQFGSWAGQLGDGRAINLGEIVNRQKQRWVLQLKGAGPTPYSRSADGLAVLRSSVREYLCSEAMHHLGIPTTRALSLITTGELVERDMFYDGNPKDEPGAVVCRVSPSFIRFGSFEIFAARKELDLLQKFIDYTILTDFPHLGPPSHETYLSWLAEICRRTAEMIIHWMRVGFVHGVMNTDNMSILGLTIDYGPYGWLENYDPRWTPNTTDAQGKRYCYGNQPHIAQWNLVQLANAIYRVVPDEDGLSQALDVYRQTFQQGWVDSLAEKLGLQEFRQESDDSLFNELLSILAAEETDMTIFFRRLADMSGEIQDNADLLELPIAEAYYRPELLSAQYKKRMKTWLGNYGSRLAGENLSPARRRQLMNSTNPKYVLRNYLAQLAIDKAEEGDFSLVNELLELLRNPYDEQSGMEKYGAKRPDWARNRPGCSMLSCSS